MVPAWSYQQVCSELDRNFGSNAGGHAESVRMVGLLFAPWHVPMARDEIIPGLDYFHHASGERVDFFCAGYSRYGPREGKRLVTGGTTPWMYSEKSFNDFKSEIESRTRWKYSGEVDLLLMNGRRVPGQAASLDFSTTVVCDLNRMVDHKEIGSCRRFFQSVFNHANMVPSADPTWGFSDQMGKQMLGPVLKNVVLSALHKDLDAGYRAASHLAVQDVSRR